MGWKELTDEQKDAFYRRYKAREGTVKLAAEVGARNPSSFERRLREWGALRRKQEMQTTSSASVAGRSNPQHQEIFTLLQQKALPLRELCNTFDRSEKTMLAIIDAMRQEGYVIEVQQGAVAAQKDLAPVERDPLPMTLADEHGQELVFAVVSDTHAGSAFSQPTNRKRFLDIAYHQYGARIVLDAGDVTDGVRGYRGQQYDTIPQSRAVWQEPFRVTQQQIWLADQYTPHYDGLTYYVLGGNHDYWHVQNANFDAIRSLCHQRADHVYLGYDVFDLPLTDRVDIRLWHPGSGAGSSLSYRLQKALDQASIEQLQAALVEEEQPRLRFLLAGHMHTEVKFSIGHVTCAFVGCFQGNTNYLKRKPLLPQIGGSIYKVRIADSGLVQRVEYVFIPFTEIKHDYLNWPLPCVEEITGQPDVVEPIFRGVKSPPTTATI